MTRWGKKIGSGASIFVLNLRNSKKNITFACHIMNYVSNTELQHRTPTHFVHADGSCASF